jgi:hypothetical protein
MDLIIRPHGPCMFHPCKEPNPTRLHQCISWSSLNNDLVTELDPVLLLHYNTTFGNFGKVNMGGFFFCCVELTLFPQLSICTCTTPKPEA